MKKISFLFFFLTIPFLNLFSQQTIHGVVVDSIGDPLIGANVILKGSEGIGTSTDIYGTFSLEIPYPPYILVFSYTGYQSVELEINTDTVKVILSESLSFTSCSYLFYYDESPIDIDMPAPVMKLIDRQLIRDNDLEIAPVLNRIPGVFMQTGDLKTSRISIRGVGARSRFATRKIRTYLDDIPLFTADGSSAIDEVDLSLVNRVDVWKGPTASNYGAGLGGMIHLKTDLFNNSFGDNSVSSKFTGGSFGLIRNVTNLALTNKKNTAGLKINLNNTHSDGFRDNGKFDRKGATVLAKFKPNRKLKTTLLFNYSNGNALNPFALNEEGWKKNPQIANPDYAEVGAYKKYTKLLFGISNQVEIAKIGKTKLINKTSLFGNIKNSEEKDPYGFYNRNRQNIGLRTSFELNKNGLNPYFNPNFSIGMEAIQEDYELNIFDLLEGEKDILFGDFLSLKNTINFFVQSYFEFYDRWTLLAGVNLNQLDYKYTRANQRYYENSNEKRTADWILSPRVGVSFELLEFVTFFSSMSHGTSPATTDEFFPSSNEIDKNVQPETGWNFEVGVRGNHNLKWKYELSFYQMNINNYLVYTHYLDWTYGDVNSGKTQYRGVEAYVEYDFNYRVKGLVGYASYSFNESKFVEFDNGRFDFAGNEIPGAPQNLLNIGFDYRSIKGIYGNLNYRFVDEFAMNDENSAYSDSYGLINLKLGYQKKFSNNFQFDFFVGVQNLYNKEYASLIRVQRNIYNISNPEFYYAGLPRNIYGGVSIKFNF